MRSTRITCFVVLLASAFTAMADELRIRLPNTWLAARPYCDYVFAESSDKQDANLELLNFHSTGDELLRVHHHILDYWYDSEFADSIHYGVSHKHSIAPDKPTSTFNGTPMKFAGYFYDAPQYLLSIYADIEHKHRSDELWAVDLDLCDCPSTAFIESEVYRLSGITGGSAGNPRGPYAKETRRPY